MSTKNLAIYRANALLEAEELESAMDSLDEARVVRLCQCHRIAGIASLLMSANAGEFRNSLSRSARAYARFSQRAAQNEKLNSLAAPFFDALSAGDIGAARTICANRAPEPNLGEEYEEDFLYHTILMGMFFGAADNTNLLARYEKLAVEHADLRFDVCAALATADPGEFEDALCAYLDDYQRRYAEALGKNTILLDQFMTEGRVCVEGIAIVSLARSRHIDVGTEYALVPSVARPTELAS